MREKEREKRQKEGEADAWESSAFVEGGAQPDTGERKSRNESIFTDTYYKLVGNIIFS